jgi:hypothetical protein
MTRIKRIYKKISVFICRICHICVIRVPFSSASMMPNAYSQFSFTFKLIMKKAIEARLTKVGLI